MPVGTFNRVLFDEFKLPILVQEACAGRVMRTTSASIPGDTRGSGL